MLLDVTEITVRSGRGGDGAVAFRREAFVPRGGPSGGDGGHGGSVVISVDAHKRTLLDFQYKHIFKAEDGRPGAGGRKTGKSAKDLRVAVPPGTIITLVETGEQVADLVNPKDRLIAARGGAGGRGNAQFATATRQTPRFAEMGEKGEEFVIRLELKLIADVGIIGFPSVGKSTLISRISAAKPKIAAYHFTTLEPNLGVVRISDDRTFVVADVPGLIEGAHSGAGLGHQFLRHVERTRLLVHIVDVAGTEARDPVEDYHIINRELELHDPRVAALPQIVAMNKLDVLQDSDNRPRMEAAAAADGRDCLAISAVTGEGIPELVSEVSNRLLALDPPVPVEEQEPVERRVFTMPTPPHRRLDIRRLAPNVYLVRGTDVETLVEKADLDTEAGVEWLHGNLDQMGILSQLEELGADQGDTVFIGDEELEYQPG